MSEAEELAARRAQAAVLIMSLDTGDVIALTNAVTAGFDARKVEGYETAASLFDPETGLLLDLAIARMFLLEAQRRLQEEQHP